MDNVLVEYDIESLEHITKDILVNRCVCNAYNIQWLKDPHHMIRSLKPNAEIIQLYSQANIPICDTTPGDVMLVNVPNHYPASIADVSSRSPLSKPAPK